MHSSMGIVSSHGGFKTLTGQPQPFAGGPGRVVTTGTNLDEYLAPLMERSLSRRGH